LWHNTLPLTVVNVQPLNLEWFCCAFPSVVFCNCRANCLVGFLRLWTKAVQVLCVVVGGRDSALYRYNQPPSTNYAVRRRDSSLSVPSPTLYNIVLALQPQPAIRDTRTHTLCFLHLRLSTATVLAPFVARIGNFKYRDWEVLSHYLILWFSLHSCTLQFVSVVILNLSALYVFIPYWRNN
jgi:hypothetical protein